MQEINMKSIICCLPLFCCLFRGVLENVLLDVNLSCSSETRSQEQRNDEICQWVKPFTV